MLFSGINGIGHKLDRVTSEKPQELELTWTRRISAPTWYNEAHSSELSCLRGYGPRHSRRGGKLSGEKTPPHSKVRIWATVRGLTRVPRAKGWLQMRFTIYPHTRVSFSPEDSWFRAAVLSDLSSRWVMVRWSCISSAL